MHQMRERERKSRERSEKSDKCRQMCKERVKKKKYSKSLKKI